MGNRYVKCRHCVYCQEKGHTAKCTFYIKTIDPGIACCENVVYTPAGLSKRGKKERKILEQEYQKKGFITP